MMLDSYALETRLRKEGYSSAEARGAIEALRTLSQELIPLLEAWQENRAYPPVEIEGYTLQDMMDEYTMHAVGAILTLDWLCKEPNEARQAMRKGIK